MLLCSSLVRQLHAVLTASQPVRQLPTITQLQDPSCCHAGIYAGHDAKPNATKLDNGPVVHQCWGQQLKQLKDCGLC